MGQNFSVWKDKVRISMFAVDESDKNSNVYKDKARIRMFERIGPQFQ